MRSRGRLALQGPLAIAAALALLAGCARAPVQLGKAQLAGTRPAGCARADAPRVWFARTVDGRADPSAALGTIGSRTFGSAEASGWIDDELAALASPGFTVGAGSEPDPGVRLVLRPRIHKAYLDQLVITKTAVVVLGVEIASPNGEATARSYRGQSAGVNWASSEDEGSGALRDAAAACLEQLRADLERILHPGQPVPSACPAPVPDAASSEQ